MCAAFLCFIAVWIKWEHDRYICRLILWADVGLSQVYWYQLYYDCFWRNILQENIRTGDIIIRWNIQAQGELLKISCFVQR